MFEELVARVRYHIQKANFMGLKEAESTLLLGEAADAIEQLSNAGSAYGRGWTLGYDAGREESKPRWIPATERLPEKSCKCLVYTGRGEYGGYDITSYSEMTMTFLDYEIGCEKVTHWMPLPPMPKEAPKEG